MAFKIRRGVLGTPDTMAHSNASQSIAPSFTPVTSPQIADSERQPSPHVGPTGVVRRGAGRASNEARAWLAVANVTPTGYRVGVFMANHSRYARAADRRRNVAPGEIFTYWPQAKIAAELGCSERQVSRGVRSLREAGALTVRQRVRPCEASYVWSRSVGSDVGSHVGSGVVSGVGSHTEPRTEPITEPSTEAAAASPSVRTEVQHDEHNPPTRQTCPTCGNTWPARFGPICYQCPQPTASQIRRQKQKKDDLESEKPWTPEELAAFKAEQDPPARPDPPPMTPETRAQLETEAIENGFHKLDDGSWTKRNAPSPSPSPPVEPTATPEQAQKHINDMLDTIRNTRAPLPRRRRRAQGWTKLTDIPSP